MTGQSSTLKHIYKVEFRDFFQDLSIFNDFNFIKMKFLSSNIVKTMFLTQSLTPFNDPG